MSRNETLVLMYAKRKCGEIRDADLIELRPLKCDLCCRFVEFSTAKIVKFTAKFTTEKGIKNRFGMRFGLK
jgi:hypothetical protein